jgi:hypothetical protein
MCVKQLIEWCYSSAPQIDAWSTAGTCSGALYSGLHPGVEQAHLEMGDDVHTPDPALAQLRSRRANSRPVPFFLFPSPRVVALQIGGHIRGSSKNGRHRLSSSLIFLCCVANQTTMGLSNSKRMSIQSFLIIGTQSQFCNLLCRQLYMLPSPSKPFKNLIDKLLLLSTGCGKRTHDKATPASLLSLRNHLNSSPLSVFPSLFRMCSSKIAAFRFPTAKTVRTNMHAGFTATA